MSSTRPQAIGDTLPQVVTCAVCGAAVARESIACDGCGRALRTSKAREPGTVLGAYRVIETLGEGGMGVVYLAEHTRLGRRVAIKMLRSEYSNNPTAVHRFFAEARAVNKISHQNIVEITDFIENPGADNYYVMELLRGTSLATLMDRSGTLPLARSVGIMAQVASALEAVHDAGIVHRDLKPDNVFLIERAGQKDFVKLLDFGVAKLAGVSETIAIHQTAAGAILGTPEYMSPEQASGRAVDSRTDVYAFGVMLYELVTGRLPLIGASFGELVVKHLTIAPTPPRKVPDLPHAVPASLEDLILACLAKDVADRPAQIITVAERLAAIADAEGWSLTSFSDSPRTTGRMAVLSPLHRPTPPEVAVQAAVAPRRRSLRPVLVVALGAAIAFAAAFFAFGRRVPEASQTVEFQFETTPAGAEVFHARAAAAIGRTPVTVTLERSDRQETFELRLAEHDVATYSVRGDRSSRISTTLVRTPVPAPPTVVASPPITAPPVAVVAPPVVRKVKTTRKIDPKHGSARKPDGGGKPDPGAGSGSSGSGSPATKPVDRSGVLNPFEKR